MKVIVKRNNSKQWDVFVDGELIEGGFFSREAAEKCAEELRAGN